MVFYIYVCVCVCREREESESGGQPGMEMKERIRVRKRGNTSRVQLKEISSSTERDISRTMLERDKGEIVA